MLLVQLADRRAEDHAEVDAGRAVDVRQPPGQGNLLHHRAGVAQPVRGRERVRGDVRVDLVAAEVGGERDPQPGDRSSCAGISSFGRSDATSDGCGPAITFSSSAQSATVRASGPSWQ